MQTFPSRKAGRYASDLCIASVVGRARRGGRGARGRRWRPGEKESRRWPGKEEGDARSPELRARRLLPSRWNPRGSPPLSPLLVVVLRGTTTPMPPMPTPPPASSAEEEGRELVLTTRPQGHQPRARTPAWKSRASGDAEANPAPPPKSAQAARAGVDGTGPARGSRRGGERGGRGAAGSGHRGPAPSRRP
jgi:hypothetical protein